MMRTKRKTKFVHEGDYVAEVDIELIDDDTGWTPHISVEDAHKLDDVREALRRRDFAVARRYGRVYHLEPIDA